MIAAIDVGNSNLRVGLYKAGVKKTVFSISAAVRRTADELALLILQFLAQRGLNAAAVEGSVVSSVSPAYTPVVCEAARLCFGKAPLTVGHGIRTGLDIRTEKQAELGSDIVANAVGARAKCTSPFVVADLGTATTVSLVDKEDCFQGVAILPGLAASAHTLAQSCANLPEISITEPKALLGKNTNDSLVGGLVFGFAAMIDGMIDRILAEYGVENLALFACGGAAGLVIPRCRHKITLSPDLTLDGLVRLYEMNRSPKKC